MKRMIPVYILVAASTLALQASPNKLKEQGFDPAYAADQPILDFQSMVTELTQFQHISSWYLTKGRLENKKLEREGYARAVRRSHQRAKSETISKAEID